MTLQMLRSWYSQFGGFRLLKAYARIGVLWAGVNSVFYWLSGRMSFKDIFISMLKKVEPFLVNKYSPIMLERKMFYAANPCDHQRNKVIWFCWLQGMQSAPEIVKACYHSLSKQTEYSIKVIDNNNWREYIDLPFIVIKRWEEKQIPAANFSDLLRLQLLIRYGGTWIDATVLCTGNNNTGKFFDADLFVFQYTKRMAIPISVSNWFITSCTNNELLMVLRDMLFAYWEEYDCVLDYYIFHLFFSMLSREYPQMIRSMPYANSNPSLVLVKSWGERYDKQKWSLIAEKVDFHKLAHRVSKKVRTDKDNYYNMIISSFV